MATSYTMLLVLMYLDTTIPRPYVVRMSCECVEFAHVAELRSKVGQTY